MSLTIGCPAKSPNAILDPIVHRQEKLPLYTKDQLLRSPAFASAQMESYCSPDAGIRPYGAGMWLRGNLSSGMRGIPTS